MNFEIRPETATDVTAIEAVTIAAFLDAAHTSHTEQLIVDGLRKAGQLAVSLVADAQGQIVGHVALSRISISEGTPGWFGLGPVSVLPQVQRRGIGSRLIRDSLRMIQEQGAAGCVVLGEPAYYGRFGFKADPRLVLPGVPPAYFQALSFGSGVAGGSVSYHLAFNA